MPSPRGVPLSQSHPALALELHPTKNDDWTAENLVAGTNRKLWWICKAVSESPCGHVWQAYGSNRSRKNQGCPACSNHAVHNDGRNSMRITNPELAEEFHPTNNGNLTPDDIIASTGKKLWWRCRVCQNEWEASGSRRAKRGSDCPACSNKAIHSDGRNSMLRTHPELAAEFHPSKNDPHTTRSLVTGTNRKLWWLCNQCQNEWQASGSTRLRGCGCPSCSGRSVHIDRRNSMVATHPEIAKEFHPTKNGKLSPTTLKAGTNRKLWWICKTISENPCGHVWQTSGGDRLKHGCPKCGRIQAARNQRTPKPGESLSDLFPELAVEWHVVKNGDKTPIDFNPGSDEKVWWKCDEAEDHVWEARISSRTGPRSTGCPFCAGRRVSNSNSISALLSEITDEWITSKNDGLSPSEVLAGSMEKFWWRCSRCKHEWKISPSNRQFGSGCPACTNKAVHIDGRNSMRATHPNLAIEFDLEKNAPLKPETLIAGTNKRIWWICKDCSHNWSAVGNSRAFNGVGCPACANKAVHIDGRNSLMMTHPEIAAEFDLSKNAPLNTEDIIAGSHKLYWWVCKSCSYEWTASPGNRSRNQGSGCPECAQTGFNPNQTAYYYVNEIINTETKDRLFYKAGISNDWKRRLHHLSLTLPANMEIRNIEYIEFEKGRDASSLELKLKKVDEIRAPDRGFPGGSELFLQNPLDYAREIGWINPNISDFERIP